MEPVAIIGMGCRFPGAPDLHTFWQLMCSGGDAIVEVPADRYDINAYYDPRPATPGKVMSRYGGFLEQVDQFDAAFFGISPREAAKMDPQHRLLLEVAWEAMEDAGQIPRAMTTEERLDIGCFIGVITGDYWDRQFRSAVDLDVYATAGNARSGAAGRISFSQNLMGASFVIDAACSSSLVAVDQAVQNLRSGACTMAVAGGVNIILNPDHTIGFSQGQMMAADGHCKTYDAAADGYVRSEGAGVVVLKLLSQALADGDRIYAVIRGCAANNDGHCTSFMAPSTAGQQAGLRKACRNAGVDPLSIAYVEAHGPGTRAGDPIEITTLGEVLCSGRSSERPLLVGSVKTNIGHTEGAAGVAGLIKAVLCLKHGVIPPNLHFHTPNPDIPWQDYALKIPTELLPWPDYASGSRRAAVCSYGIAGTNTYIVLEEAPRQCADHVTSEVCATAHLLPLSAQAPDALKELARRYLDYLESDRSSGVSLRDLSATASLRRVHHDYRLALVSRSRQEARDKLVAFLQGEMDLEVSSGQCFAYKKQKVAWIFPGQGSQWLGMGRDLLEQEPVFRAALEECDRVMRAYVDWSLLEQLQANEENTRLDDIDVIQPMLFAVEVALAALWRSWGLEPAVVVGHSMGEVAAAYVAGALSLEDAAWIICSRSRLLLRVSGKGAMAVVELSLEHARALISDYKEQVSVAVSNSPHSTVLAGDPQALTEILALLARQDIFGRLVRVDIASHSSQMDPLRPDLLRLMERIQPRPTTVPMFSTVYGRMIEGSELEASYWAANLREPVLFLSAIQTLLTDDCEIFLEMSPHPLLVSAIRQSGEQVNRSALALPTLQRQVDGRSSLLTTLGRLYVQGFEPDWSGLHLDKGQHASLPTYPWQRQRCWNVALNGLLARATLVAGRAGACGHPILGVSTPSALHPRTLFWTATLEVDMFPYLGEHRVHGMPVLACAAYLELALAAAHEVCGSRDFALEDLVLKKALFLPEGTPQTLQVILAPQETGTMSLRFFSIPTGQEKQTTWVEHAEVTVRFVDGSSRSPSPCFNSLCLPDPDVPEPGQQCKWKLAMDAPVYYAGLRARGIQHGPLFQGITHVWRWHNEVIARIAIPERLKEELPGYQLHPALLDACLQGITPFLPEEPEEETYVPVAVRQVHFHQQPDADALLWTYALLHSAESGPSGTLEGDVYLLNEHGQVLLEVLGLRLQALGGGNTQEFLRQRLNQLLYTLQWEPNTHTERQELDMFRKNWLIFDERTGLGQALAEHLRAHGAHCVLVVPGDTYRQLEPQLYMLPPTDPQAFHRLLGEVYKADDGLCCQGMVYLWGMLATSPLEQDYAEIGALHLLQATASASQAGSPRLWLVTSGVQFVEDQDEASALFQAPLWGLGRVMVYEHPDLHTTLIDLNKSSLIEQSESLFQEVWLDNVEDEVALRGERRYVARLVRHQMPEEREQNLFCSDGTYLITGGLGGVGLRTAQWMVEQGARHLVLLGRREASEAATATLTTLRATGVNIRTMQVDVSQERQLACALDRIRRELPPLRGVFHSAVVLDDGTLLQLDRERFLGVRPARVEGAWNLHQLTLHDPLDYFVLFSSAASLIGSPGQGNYAAASAFLDQLALYRRKKGYPALCLNWGRWGEVGQATREKRGERLDARGFVSMKPVEGLAILGGLLRQGPPQVGAMSFSLSRWSQFYPNLTRSSLFTHLRTEIEAQQDPQAGVQRLTREMLAELAGEQRHQALIQYLNDQIARVLGHTTLKLEARQQLDRLGLDSLMSVELKNRIGSDLDVSIPVTTFLQGITFEQFIAQIGEQLE